MVVSEARLLTDIEVVQRVRAGEAGLYELLMRRHNQRLFRVIRSVIPNESEAEDVLQDAWVRAYEHLDQFAARSSFATWVTRIAYYDALARARGHKRYITLEDETGEIMPPNPDTSEESPEAQAIRGELGGILEAAIDALPEGYRTVFVLREVEQSSTSETAESLGLSEEAVKTRLHRARALLRRDLETRIGPVIARSYSFLGPRCDRTVAAVLRRIGANCEN